VTLVFRSKDLGEIPMVTLQLGHHINVGEVKIDDFRIIIIIIRRSKSQAVTYTVTVAISRKRCKIEM